MNQSNPAEVRPAEPLPSTANPPRVWLVTGYRAGERSQVLALAEALGWPFELKELSYRKAEFLTSLFRGSDLRGIRLSESSPLQAPWPDLVISAGMRNEPVCRWIRIQSGGRTRIVHIGRPWARLERFDLVVTTPQYRLARRDNVLHNTVTLHRVTADRLARHRSDWAARFADLPGPYIAIVLGGNSGPYTLGPGVAARLAERACRLAAERHGSLLITTSARTPEAAIRALENGLDVPYSLYRWKRGDSDNPYFGMLALADEIIVTADSISMLSEACASGKPVHMMELDGSGYPMRPDAVRPGNPDFGISGWFYSLVMRFGPLRLSRDIRLVHRRLLEEGRVVWLGDPFNGSPSTALPDLERAVDRVKCLFDGCL